MRTLHIFARGLIGENPVKLLAIDLAFGVLIKTADADIANPVSCQYALLKCQDRVCHPQRNVSRNTKNNPILALGGCSTLTSGWSIR